MVYSVVLHNTFYSK